MPVCAGAGPSLAFFLRPPALALLVRAGRLPRGCGWRSLAGGICERGLEKFSGPRSDVLAYLGPAISQAHFEVGIDVLEAFFSVARNVLHADEIAAAFIPGARPLHFYADIYALARAELNALGVTAIYGGGDCTFIEAERFYSYRRDKTTGRMASLIWLE